MASLNFSSNLKWMLSVLSCYFYLVCDFFLRCLLGVQSHTTNVPLIFNSHVIPLVLDFEIFTFGLWNSNPGTRASSLPWLMLILLCPKFSLLLFYCSIYNFQTYFTWCGNTCCEKWSGTSSLFYTNHGEKLRVWWISLATDYKRQFKPIFSPPKVSCSTTILKSCWSQNEGSLQHQYKCLQHLPPKCFPF